MKLKSILAVAALAATLTACETTYQATDTGVIVVPDGTQKVFLDQYPGSANVVWSRYDPNVVVLNEWELTGWQTLDESDYVVRFDLDNENYYAWYDSDGAWIGTAYVVKDYTTLPSLVSTSVNNKYPLHTMTSVNREYYKDRMLYEITLKKDDAKVVVLVDANGNIVKEKIKY
ncbi:MAG TPA: PepSY-like domain-containing protein [Chitinophagaceae bacterium]|nr:PepSY-like domain-containing protein [Chitinophagaceae bacterium]